MTYPWIDEYCSAKVGCEHDFKEEWSADRYMLRGKMFVMLGGDKEGKPIISVKGDPMENMSVREAYSDIIPGYYLNKTHWNSVYLEGNVPKELIQKMIDQSYELILNSFSKKVQAEILSLK